MKFIIVSSFVPFIHGGARFIAEWLEAKLQEHGHKVERFYLPFHEDPDELLSQIFAYRLIDLSQCSDRLVCFRPPAHVLQHPYKIVWFIHHFRVFYDLWDTAYCNVAHTPRNLALRKALMEIDTRTIAEAQRIYTNSRIVADRLKQFNGINATTLYPPLFNPERFHNDGYGDEILVVCRMEPHKRPHLLVKAMRHVETDVRLRLCGASASPSYAGELRSLININGLGGRVIFDNRWISEEEKVALTAKALAVAYIPADEDSYGYPSLEAAHAEKAILTTNDAGGVLEFVQDGRSGIVVPPDSLALAQAMDRLYADRGLARRMGLAAHQQLAELKINWSAVIDAMTQ